MHTRTHMHHSVIEWAAVRVHSVVALHSRITTCVLFVQINAFITSICQHNFHSGSVLTFWALEHDSSTERCRTFRFHLDSMILQQQNDYRKWFTFHDDKSMKYRNLLMERKKCQWCVDLKAKKKPKTDVGTGKSRNFRFDDYFRFLPFLSVFILWERKRACWLFLVGKICVSVRQSYCYPNLKNVETFVCRYNLCCCVISLLLLLLFFCLLEAFGHFFSSSIHNGVLKFH